MTTANKVLTKAASYIGYTEKGGRDGKSGNITQFWERQKPSYQGGAWCAAFVLDVFEQCGNTLLKEVPLPYLTTSMEAWAKKTNRWGESKNAKPGDVVIFGGSSHATHTGILVGQHGANHIETIEGNTSPGNSGSQTNGGGVYRRIRPRSFVRGTISMQDQFTQAPPAGPPGTPARLDEDGEIGPKTIDALEWYVGKAKGSKILRDGVLNRMDVREVQTWLGRERTGVLGKDDIKALQRKVGSAADGEWGPNTTLGLQRFLNKRLAEV